MAISTKNKDEDFFLIKNFNLKLRTFFAHFLKIKYFHVSTNM